MKSASNPASSPIEVRTTRIVRARSSSRSRRRTSRWDSRCGTTGPSDRRQSRCARRRDKPSDDRVDGDAWRRRARSAHRRLPGAGSTANVYWKPEQPPPSTPTRSTEPGALRRREWRANRAWPPARSARLRRSPAASVISFLPSYYRTVALAAAPCRGLWLASQHMADAA